MSRERQTMLHINYTSKQYAVKKRSLPGHKLTKLLLTFPGTQGLFSQLSFLAS